MLRATGSSGQKSCNQLNVKSRRWIKSIYMKKKPTEIKLKTKSVLPILLLWETVTEVLSSKSGIHFNNLKHKSTALKINMTGSPAVGQNKGQTTLINAVQKWLWNGTNLISFNDGEQHLNLLWAGSWGQDTGTEKEKSPIKVKLSNILMLRITIASHKDAQLILKSKLNSKETLQTGLTTWVKVSVRTTTDHLPELAKKSSNLVSYNRSKSMTGGPDRICATSPARRRLIRMGSAEISTLSWEF